MGYITFKTDEDEYVAIPECSIDNIEKSNPTGNDEIYSIQTRQHTYKVREIEYRANIKSVKELWREV